MRIQKDFSNILLIVILAIIVVGVGSWYLGKNANTPAVQPEEVAGKVDEQPNSSNSSAAPVQISATINQSSLATNSANPIINGSLLGTSAICAWIGKGSVSVPATITEPDAMPGYVWGVCSSTGAISISNGHWSTKVDYPSGEPVLQKGTYTIAISNWDTTKVLTSAVFSVQ